MIAASRRAIGIASLFVSFFLTAAGEILRAIAFYLGIINIFLGVFNLLPGFPMDGGRVLRSIIWQVTGDLPKATKIASRIGQGLAFFLIFAGILQILWVGLSGFWLVFVGWFLAVLLAGCHAHRPGTSDLACNPDDLVPNSGGATYLTLDTEPCVDEACCEVVDTSFSPLDVSDYASIQYREMTLQECIDLALRNSKVFRDLGGSIITAPQLIDGIYDPATPNGRLLLGLKGHLSEFELHTLRSRLTAGLLNKAQRGELALLLPVGLVRDAQGQVHKEANVEVQQRLQLVFDTFLRRTSASKVLRFFNDHELQLPLHR